MTDAVTVAGALLVATVIGAVPVGWPPMPSLWSMARDDHARTVAAHRRTWAWLNAGFMFATVVTAGGLAALAVALDGDARRTALLAGISLAYAIAGVPWCAVLAIRTRMTPALVDLDLIGAPAAVPEVLLGAATGGLFASFVIATGAVLVALGVTLAVLGGVALPVAAVSVVVGALAVALQLTTGDFIPAVLYLPTLLIGVALLAGWT